MSARRAWLFLYPIKTFSVNKILTGSHTTVRYAGSRHISALLRLPLPACLLPVIHSPAKVSRPLSISNS